MPVQRIFFGWPVPAMPPRRIAVLLGSIALFAVITLVFTLPNSIPSGPSLGRFTDHKISLPKLPKTFSSPSILSPFRVAAHPPPVLKNTTSGDSKWYSNWNWLSPFSSSVTLDENRSLLPPLNERPPIYTYYDHTQKKAADLKAADNALLLTWRRAWWAQGFQPIILSPAEALNNPLYAELQTLELDSTLKVELSRWLAWENMGTGILCNYLVFPMGAQEDHLLSFLRRGKYPKLTRFENLGHGIFVGSKAEITAAVKTALDNPELKTAKDFISTVPKETFQVDPHHESVAYYDPVVVKNKYPKIDEAISKGANGLEILNKLIISHLHGTWRNRFSKGIAVLKPEPDHMSAAIEPAFTLAEFLAQCPESPMPSSCPPNRPKCSPCMASTPLKISTPPTYRNTSELYTIGTVPHPFTMAVLSSFRDNIDVPWIRRESSRDPWITALTKEVSGTGVSSAPRIIKFKEAVASEHGTFHTLWLTAEKEVPQDLDWRFGFTIPRNATDTGKSETPVPGPERRPQPKPDPKNGPVANPDDVKKERELLKRAKDFGQARTPAEEKLRGAIEAWNLADTEAWRFARAFLARSRVERLKWEEEEKHYVGGAGAERGKSSGWGRWFDD
ncbi:Uncharacterized protein BP5553_00252 [Venustampulla echinocandica]|uniref:Uncharacterized protein n=1 Tax=Venustampulla echinocandica TaxID=2656787 RepID=A0A370TXN5_9HELO|nr:Uncharacterized protein BP5553_00252 [Venustampulla echinocandica]RDL40273.1 Uncharacterized protein BP5553_00252 [Venustampulla echinocandica]